VLELAWMGRHAYPQQGPSERRDFRFPDLIRMGFFMEENEAFYPMHIGLLGSGAVVTHTKCISALVQQAGFGHGRLHGLTSIGISSLTGA